MKKAFVKTYGCQMNVYDSERMQEMLAGNGYELANAVDEAELVILNTCHIREKAVDKVYSELGKIDLLKRTRAKRGLETVIAVAGCVAQAEGAEIVRRARSVDLVFGPQTYHRLPELLARRHATGKPVVETDFPVEDKFDSLGRLTDRKGLNTSVAAFLTVQEGCDKFCTFCVVPYTRGAEFSRPVAQVLAEAQQLVARGVREVTLLGQNVNAYCGKDEQGEPATLAKLVTVIAEIPGLERVRYTTSHPRDMSDDLIEEHARNSKLMPYLHLPVQAGSDRILKAMNRGHTADSYVKLIEKVRNVRPDIAISGDFITGFPGETEADFEQTLAIVREIRYASAYSFKYSPRAGTPAAEIRDQVPEEVKSDRLQRLQALITVQMQAFNASCVDLTLPVLVEKPGRNPGQLIGRSPYLQAVSFDGEKCRPGEMVNVLITGTHSNSLAGQIKQVAA
jgi:tRNA-2-methylthio-N6-dimethylallyladenosine synthase